MSVRRENTKHNLSRAADLSPLGCQYIGSSWRSCECGWISPEQTEEQQKTNYQELLSPRPPSTPRALPCNSSNVTNNNSSNSNNHINDETLLLLLLLLLILITIVIIILIIITMIIISISIHIININMIIAAHRSALCRRAPSPFGPDSRRKRVRTCSELLMPLAKL